MRTRWWMVSFVTTLMVQTPHMAAADTRQESIIEQTAEAYRKAVLAGDAAAVIATYGHDAVEMPPNCPPLKGRAAIERYYRELFSRPMKMTDFTFTHLETASAGNIGFTTGVYKRRLSAKTGESIEDSGSFVVIVKRDAGGWKSAYVIYNSDRPPMLPGALVPVSISPLPALMNYCSAIASQWRFRFAVVALGCVCLGLSARLQGRGGNRIASDLSQD